MRESIIICNVGPLQEVNIENIRPLTVLIGQSASGKSTFLKVLVLMRYIYKMLNIRAYLHNSGISRSPFRLSFKNLLSRELSSAITTNSVIKYTVTHHGNQYNIAYEKGKLKYDKNFLDQDISFFKESFISETRNIIPQWMAHGASIRGKEIDFYFQQTYDDFDRATNSIESQDLTFVGFNMHVTRSGQRKKLLIKPQNDEHQHIELHNASSGIQTGASLMTLIHYFSHKYSFSEGFKRSILSYLFEGDQLTKFKTNIELKDLEKYIHLHVEEPELSLYPDAQRKLVNALVSHLFPSNDTKRDWQMGLVMATHSPYVINQFNVLIENHYAHREQRQSAQNQLPELSPDDIEAYFVNEGTFYALKTEDPENNHAVLDTFILTEELDKIADEYFSLRGGENGPDAF